MNGASVPLICRSCGLSWRELPDAPSASIRCPDCGESVGFLEAAAVAWALGHIARADFFELAGRVAPDDVTEALSALAKVSAWWEDRTTDHSPGGDPAERDRIERD